MDSKTEVSFETKLEIVAKAFWLDCVNDADYPHLTWHQQAKELRRNSSEKFIELCYEMNKDNPDIIEYFGN